MKRIASVALAALLSSSAFVSQAHAFGSAGAMGGAPSGDQSPQVLAQGVAGVLTTDALNAYVEALEFCLAQVGSPKVFTPVERQQISQVMAQGFSSLPIEAQQGLANARATWTQYRNAWNGLNLEQQKAFAYDVLALAYGDQAAAQALGMTGGGASSGSSGGGSGGFSEPCYTCTEEGSIIYGGGVDLGGGEMAY